MVVVSSIAESNFYEFVLSALFCPECGERAVIIESPERQNI